MKIGGKTEEKVRKKEFCREIRQYRQNMKVTNSSKLQTISHNNKGTLKDTSSTPQLPRSC